MKLGKLFSTVLILALMLSALPAQFAGAAPPLFANPTTTIFINEIHYDNTGTDTGEAVEIAGPAGFDLTDWTVALYNGSPSVRKVYNTIDLSGTIPDQQSGFGTLAFFQAGIQNGGPDGLALVDAANTVVQFLSYEGSFTAVDGPAAGMTSTDIGESESPSTPIDSSLQLTGTGTTYGDFTWAGSQPNTFGSVNTGQTFGGAPPDTTPPLITSFTPADDSTGVAVDTNLLVQFNENVQFGTGNIVLYKSSDNSVVETFDVTTSSQLSVSGDTVTIDPTNDLSNSTGYYVTLDNGAVEDLSNNPYQGFSGTGVWNFTTADATPISPLIINEVDYDQPGIDTAEFVEIRNNDVIGVDLSAYSLQFVNGNGGAVYDTINLPAVSLAADDYFVVCANTATVTNCDLDDGPDTNFIQNGPPDAVALYFGSTLIDTVSYEGDTVAPYTEGSGSGLEDSSDGSISRCDDGTDTDQNNVDFVFTGISTPGEENACVPPVTTVKIHEVQGSGLASPLVGQTVLIEGIVVGDFQDDVGANGDLNGFFVQEEDADADADPATSEGVFVFQGSNPTIDVVIGDQVRVEGSVSEYFGDTQITSFSGVTVNSSGNTLPAASVLSLPVASVDDFEAYEGMYVTFPQPLVISEYYNFDRFGEIVLTDARHFQPTAVFEPGSVDAANLATANSLARITLDDGRTSQNPDPAIHPNGLEFDLTNLFRGGDTVANVTGVINYSFGLYRVQPTQGANYTSVNARPASPDPVGGNLTVAAFNVLNYFTTLDYPSGHPLDNMCGPLQNQGCRGADDAGEFTRQRDKIIAAIAEIDADVVGLIEIENHPTDVPLDDLVSGLNDAMGSGTYEYVATGPVGPDVIRVAFIYKPTTVSLVGTHAVLDTLAFLDPNNLGDDKNRAALAQTFMDNSNGGVFTAVVNHLKSKGSGCGVGDDDPEQGSCNLTRTLAAQELVTWLATDPTGSGDSDMLILGDLNAYDKEDPIDVLVADGYTDLAYHFEGEFAYSYVFSGQWGYLDYALANADLLDQVTGATEWHINADEADLIDYDTSYKKDAQDAIYAPDAYRASDHDPVIVGLQLHPPFPTTSILDDFNRSNGRLGSNWKGSKRAYRIRNEQVDVRRDGPIYWKHAFGVDQEVFVTITAVDQNAWEQDLLLKVQDVYGPNWGDGVIEVLYSAKTNSVTVWTFRPDTLNWFMYAPIPATFVDGDQFGAQALSTGDVVIMKNGFEIGRVTLNAADQSFFNPKGGNIGLWFIDAGKAYFDDFGGGDISHPEWYVR